MGKIKFKLEYPEFSNLFLSLYVLSGIDPDFRSNYPHYLQSRNKDLSDKDKEYLELFKNQIIELVQNKEGLNIFKAIILDHKIDNLIMLKRKVEKELRPFNFTGIDKVYLYFYKRLLEDYKFFHFPITDLLSNLDKLLIDQKIIKHLEKFHNFLEQERRMKLDHHFILSCNYLGSGEKAHFERVAPNKLLFSLPIIIDKNNQVSFDFDEKSFLEQIFYQTLSLQFEAAKHKFGDIFEKHQIDEVDFRRNFVGALRYGIYTYDVFRETLNLERPTDYFKHTEFQTLSYNFQSSFSEKLVPLIDSSYKERRGLDETFLSSISELLSDKPQKVENEKIEDIQAVIKNTVKASKEIEIGVIFSSDEV